MRFSFNCSDVGSNMVCFRRHQRTVLSNLWIRTMPLDTVHFSFYTVLIHSKVFCIFWRYQSTHERCPVPCNPRFMNSAQWLWRNVETISMPALSWWSDRYSSLTWGTTDSKIVRCYRFSPTMVGAFFCETSMKHCWRWTLTKSHVFFIVRGDFCDGLGWHHSTQPLR